MVNQLIDICNLMFSMGQEFEVQEQVNIGLSLVGCSILGCFKFGDSAVFIDLGGVSWILEESLFPGFFSLCFCATMSGQCCLLLLIS